MHNPRAQSDAVLVTSAMGEGERRGGRNNRERCSCLWRGRPKRARGRAAAQRCWPLPFSSTSHSCSRLASSQSSLASGVLAVADDVPPCSMECNSAPRHTGNATGVSRKPNSSVDDHRSGDSVVTNTQRCPRICGALALQECRECGQNASAGEAPGEPRRQPASRCWDAPGS